MKRVPDDLPIWLLEQIAEDERIASALPENPGLWVRFGGESPREEHMLNWGRPRALAECDAKRRRIALHAEVPVAPGRQERTCLEDGSVSGYPCQSLRLEALPYVDRPGYREEWRP